MGINQELLGNARARDARRAVYDGDGYIVADSFSLASAATRNIYIETGAVPVVLNTLNTHSESGEYTLTMYEGAVATGGTPLQAVNADRTSTVNAPTSAASTDPTISVAGTPILQATQGGSNSGNSANDYRIDIPVILKAMTGYVLEWTHLATGTRDFTVSGSVFKDNRTL